MTRATNARVAGGTLLLYIVVGISQMVFFGGTTAGEGPTAKLASMAQSAPDVRINVVLGLLTCFFAITLGVTFRALTRDQDSDLAMLGMTCRVGEGVIGAVFTGLTLGLLSIATATGADAADPAAASALGSFVLVARTWNPVVCALFFAVGSTLFCWLLLQGRTIPAPLAWLGVIGSVLLVVALPLQIAGVLEAPATQLAWIPMAAFEIPLGLMWLVKGDARAPRST